MVRAAYYVRTDPEHTLPPREEQIASVEEYIGKMGYQQVASYEDLEAPGKLLYHKPALKEAINNIKEEEDWDVLVVAQVRCISDDETAIHELVHKFSLYGNRIESPERSWEELLSAMKDYRRAMARR
ncbi:MAG: recombinase family protein [Rubrobacteraceae bacterium]|uniref:recombinase family protein n=1 Tax=Rubrobacter naiadicus TaxID=1392641 RepID=UPI00235ED732|nr:recombinase family protein [Rubrobacter naiadicus]MBX6763344.1 recombinase family protein [Rubrobacteraceae bacterium]MCL6437121.1 recombinase family protein [Rubrobacteraceae bacterium]